MMKKLHLNIVSPEKELFNGGSGKCYIAGHYGLFFYPGRSMHRLYHRWERGN